MRSTLKKVFAAVLAVALCLSFAGCYDENKTWAAKKGDDTLPIGSYIYYLYSAYSQATQKVSSSEEVLKASIEDKDSQTWIREEALNSLQCYYYITGKFDELGLELTEEELDTIQTNTDNSWTYFKTYLEETLGIAKESYRLASVLYNAEYEKVMEAMYGEDGELALSEEELKSYFTDNYFSYEYFYASLTTTDDDGNSVDLTDEEKEERKSELETYVDKISTGDITVQEAAEEYAEDALGSSSNSTYQAPSPTLKDNLSDTSIKEALEGLEDNQTSLVETTTGYYVLRKLPIVDKFEDTMSDETQEYNLLYNMKGEEFSDYVKEQAKNVEGVEINQNALDSIKLTKFVTDDNKMGTSSASSEISSEASSAASESSETASSSEVEE